MEHAGEAPPSSRTAAWVDGELYPLAGGRYPTLVPGPGRIRGEILRVPASALESLDRFEGVGSGLYLRKRILATTLDGAREHCWVYVCPPETARRLADLRTPPIPDGDWAAFVRRKG